MFGHIENKLINLTVNFKALNSAKLHAHNCLGFFFAFSEFVMRQFLCLNVNCGYSIESYQ